MQGMLTTVELLIAKGADVNARDGENHTPLCVAFPLNLQYGITACVPQPPAETYLWVIRALCQAGAVYG